MLTRATVLPTTGHANNITHTTVSLANPFTAALDVTHVHAGVTFQGLTLGTVDSGTAFASEGKSTTRSPALDLSLNMDPQTLFTVTHALAQEAGLDTAQLDAIVGLGGYRYLSLNGEARREVLGEVEMERRDNLFT